MRVLSTSTLASAEHVYKTNAIPVVPSPSALPIIHIDIKRNSVYILAISSVIVVAPLLLSEVAVSTPLAPITIVLTSIFDQSVFESPCRYY